MEAGKLLRDLMRELAVQRLANSSFSVLSAAIKAASTNGARQ
jgi:hypothetical protein